MECLNEEGEEILIIEDSPTQAEYLRDILERHGYRVSAAANGRKALAAIAVRKPALIISDIIMPEMDGYELCRRIKADERNRDIPVILLTSLADPRDVIRGLECGADNFITKPYNEEYLLSRIRHLKIDRFQSARENPGGELELHFGGQDYHITADRRQIVNLLLSTYETAILKNRELNKARDELYELNAQLEAANRELEAFGYTISHDLRNPLNVISSYSQVIAEIYGDRLDEQCLEYVREITSRTFGMSKLIDALLNFSILTHHEIKRDSVDLSGMAGVIAGELRMTEPERKVRFIIADGLTANGDKQLLRLVLENLLGNAWKYSARKEEVCIEFGVTIIEGKKYFFVRDNGPGFDMAHADKLFAPFQRLQSTKEFKGHGIGLATVQRIVQRHGGRIWAEGEAGKGATFYFSL